MLPSLLFARALYSDIYSHKQCLFKSFVLPGPQQMASSAEYSLLEQALPFFPNHNFEQHIINLCMIDGAKL